jgi:hypothetical protein
MRALQANFFVTGRSNFDYPPRKAPSFHNKVYFKQEHPVAAEHASHGGYGSPCARARGPAGPRVGPAVWAQGFGAREAHRAREARRAREGRKLRVITDLSSQNKSELSF